jgi:uncharacterized protein YggE
MNALIRTIACAAICVLLVPAVAGAQQAAVPPAGITVVGTGTATVTDWVQEVDLKFTPPAGTAYQYDACTKALAALGETIHAMGLPASALVTSAIVYVSGTPSFVTTNPNAAPVAVARVQIPQPEIARFMAAANKSAWKSTARLVPRDLAGAKDSAYKAAYADAHARAATIAAADGHHLGRLLNVTPALGDYFGSMMNSVASIFDALGKGNIFNAGIPDLTESATFTFEITP